MAISPVSIVPPVKNAQGGPSGLPLGLVDFRALGLWILKP